MGAINYKTSDYITMGIKPYDTDDFTENKDFLDFIKTEWLVDINDPDAVLQAAYEDINNCYEADKMNLDAILDKYSFYYFKVEWESGYYEGMSLNIYLDYSVFDDYEEKRDAQKEVTQLRNFLIDIAGCGFVACYPGWCTGYEDYNGTISAINEAIKEMRKDVKNTPTWHTYKPSYA